MQGINYKIFIKLLRSNFVLSNLPIIIALILLASAPIFLLQNENEIANLNAGYAFYLLIVGILWKIIQYMMDKHPRKNNITSKKLR
jgi:Ca2+/Na+ antiporter